MDDLTKVMTEFIDGEAKSIDVTSPVLDPKFWERPKLEHALIGDPSVNDIYQAVGLTLSMWETLEEQLVDMYLLFCGCNESSSYRAVKRSFGTLESSSARRVAIEEAAKVYFGDELYPKGKAKAYKKLFIAHEAASKRRNDIAHGIAYNITINNYNKGSFLFPARYNSGRNQMHMSHASEKSSSFLTENYRYTAKMILDLAQKFGVFNSTIMKFHMAAIKIAGHPKFVLAEIFKDVPPKK